MAKLTGPMFGLTARGKLANTLVYSNWKGVPYTRKWLVPANPNTSAQQAQRGYLASALADWHAISWGTGDKPAYDRWAAYGSKPMSGFNKYVSEYLKVKVAGNDWDKVRGLVAVDVTATTATLTCVENSGLTDRTVEVFLGTSQGYMPVVGTATWDAVDSRYEFAATGLSSKTKYYFRVKMTSTGKEGWIGNGTFTTS